MSMLSKINRMVSLLVIIVPTVMMYFNSTPVFAVASAALAIVTEIMAKSWMVFRVKNFKKIMKALKKRRRAATVAVATESTDSTDDSESEAGTVEDNQSDNDEGENSEEDDAEIRHILGLLALRFYTDIVAEKASIICAALIALLYFRDLTETGASGGATIGLIFFAFECVCDFRLEQR